MQGNRILDHDAVAVPVVSGMESRGRETFFPLVFFTPHAG